MYLCLIQMCDQQKLASVADFCSSEVQYTSAFTKQGRLLQSGPISSASSAEWDPLGLFQLVSSKDFKGNLGMKTYEITIYLGRNQHPFISCFRVPNGYQKIDPSPAMGAVYNRADDPLAQWVGRTARTFQKHPALDAVGTLIGFFRMICAPLQGGQRTDTMRVTHYVAYYEWFCYAREIVAACHVQVAYLTFHRNYAMSSSLLSGPYSTVSGLQRRSVRHFVLDSVGPLSMGSIKDLARCSPQPGRRSEVKGRHTMLPTDCLLRVDRLSWFIHPYSGNHP